MAWTQWMSALRSPNRASKLKKKQRPKQGRPATFDVRPRLESLEDRTLFAVQALSVAAASSPLSTANKQSELSPVQSVSDNGQFTVFASTSTNVVANETANGTTVNIYLYNAVTQTVTLISHDGNNATLGGNNNSFNAVISGDGSTVAFYSTATDLINGQTPSTGSVQLYLYDNNPSDAAYGTLQLVSYAYGSPGTPTNAAEPSIPASGSPTYVNTLGYSIYNLGAGDGLALPSLSTNGQFIAYISDATNIAGANTSGGTGKEYNANLQQVSVQYTNAYYFNRQSDSNTLVSHQATSATIGGAGFASTVAISGDGSTVAFTDRAVGLVAGASTDSYSDQLYVWSSINNQAVTGLAAGQIQLASHQAGSSLTGTTIPTAPFTLLNTRGFVEQSPPSLSANGSVIAYDDAGRNLVAGQTASGSSSLENINVFAYNVLNNSNTLVTYVANNPTETGNNPNSKVNASDFGPGEANGPQISADGTIIAYANNSNNLIAGMTNASSYDNVYFYSSVTGQNTLVSHAAGSTTTMDTYGGTAPSMSSDGRYITFIDRGPSNSTSGSISVAVNVRLFDSQAAATAQPTVVGTAFDSGVSMTNFLGSLAPTIINANSAVGPVVAWDGLASDAAPGVSDTNNNFDVFEYPPASSSPSPTITSSSTPTFSYGTPGTYTITTTGFTPTSYGETGTLPTGLTFNSTTGVLSGTPTQSGTFPLTMTATNGTTSPTQNLTLTINQIPTFTSTNNTLFTVGTTNSLTITTTAYPTPTLTETNTLPTGLTFANGVLSGTPTVPGTYNLQFTATNSAGSTPQTFTLTVGQAPSITSGNTATFVIGTTNTFAVTTLGYPTDSISESGTLPSGLTLIDNGNDTATLSGLPSAGTSGSYPFTISATNSVGTTTQSFSLVIDQAPAITSAATTTFTAGTASSFTITTSGYPTATVAETSTLPAGLSFTNNGDGTATISGIPSTGDSGSYPFTITATNGVGTTASQTFSLVIDSAPTITSAATTTFTTGISESFTVTTSGYPSATVAETSTLPAGLSFTNNGDGTATISGIPSTGDSGSYPFTITATNGVGTTASQNFSLVIDQAPTITSAATTTFTAGTASSFTITTTGYPTATVAETSTLPAGLSFTNNGDGTATISGIPSTGDSGSYPFTITATNGVGTTASQTFNLIIDQAQSNDQAPAITSNAAMTFGQGITGSFTITTTGYPEATVSESGSLPTGMSFVNNGDGTATLSGTPTVSGTFPLTLMANNGVGDTATQNFTLYLENFQKPGSFAVSNASASGGSIVLTFSAAIEPASTELYANPGDTTVGPADVMVTGPDGTPIRGSLVFDATNPDMATFVQTSGALAPGTYTVDLTSAVEEVGGTPLSGGYVATVTVPTSPTPVLSVPNFARGPGQQVQINDSLGNQTGIPVSIDDATNVTQVSFTLTYDPVFLTIPSTGALTLSLPAQDAGLDTVNYTINSVNPNESVLSVTITSSSQGDSQSNITTNGGGSSAVGLTTNLAEPLVTIAASVPTTALYLDSAVLDLGNVVVNTTTATSVPGTGVSGVQAVAYLGDVSGTGAINALDASLVDQVGAGAGTGFSAYKDLDPSIIGGVNGHLAVSALDASLINEAAAGAVIPQIPVMPANVVPTFMTPDPYLYLSSIQASPGQTVTETVYLDVTDPNGIQLSALDEAIGFDSGELQISNVRNASGLLPLGSYGTASEVDNASGTLLVGQAFAGSGLPPMLPYGTDIPVLQFDVTLKSDAVVGSVTGLTLLEDGTINGQTKYTAISDNQGPLAWTVGKAPSNSGNAAIDGSVTTVPVASAPANVNGSTSQKSSKPQTKVSVRRTTPTPVSEPVTVISTIPAATSAGLVEIVVNVETTTVNASPSVSITEDITPALTTIVVNVTLPASAAEGLQVANASLNPVRSADPGAALSLAAVGIGRTTPTASTGMMATTKASTTILDELYSQPGSGRVNLWLSSGSADDLTADWEDWWFLEPTLDDPAANP